MSHGLLLYVLGLVVIGAPALLVLILGGAAVADQKLPERTIARLVPTAIIAGLIASVAVLGVMLVDGTRLIPISLGHWVEIPSYHVSLKFVFDRLSMPFVILSFLLCGTSGAFASRYMHREPGYNRFFSLYSLFVLGMVIASLAGTIETLFVGWELVGLSSALLVAFFHERPAPVRNGSRIWSVYRFSDAALLVAALALHHLHGKGDFSATLSKGLWPMSVASLTFGQATFVGFLLLVAAAGKSALVPFSGWLPRAMEGPTPSSAVFYGALSVHLGAFLLLRTAAIISLSWIVCLAIVILGLTTATYASLVARVQTDIKSALSYASLTQVGIIVTEIGLGYWSFWFYYVALTHILGHACLRTLQFLRASSLLQDYRSIENALGSSLPRFSDFLTGNLSEKSRRRLYRYLIDRGYLDVWLNNYVVWPVIHVFLWCDALERRCLAALGGRVEEPDPPTTSLDDLG